MEKINLMSRPPDFVDNAPDLSLVPPEFEDVHKGVFNEANKRLSELQPLIFLIENPKDIQDESYRIHLFAKLSFGLRKAGEHLAWAMYQHKLAYIERKRFAAVAAFDNFGTFVQERKNADKEVKTTDPFREHYVNFDKDHIESKKREAMAEALVEQFSTIRTEFIVALNTLRSICYGIKDSGHMSSAASTFEK